MKIILPLHCRCSHVRFLAAPNESVCELLQDSIARFNIIDEPEGGIKNRLKSFFIPTLMKYFFTFHSALFCISLQIVLFQSRHLIERM